MREAPKFFFIFTCVKKMFLISNKYLTYNIFIYEYILFFFKRVVGTKY